MYIAAAADYRVYFAVGLASESTLVADDFGLGSAVDNSRPAVVAVKVAVAAVEIVFEANAAAAAGLGRRRFYRRITRLVVIGARIARLNTITVLRFLSKTRDPNPSSETVAGSGTNDQLRIS